MTELQAYEVAVAYLRCQGYDNVRRCFAQRVSYESIENLAQAPGGFFWEFGIEIIRDPSPDYVDSSTVFGIIVDETTGAACSSEEHIDALFGRYGRDSDGARVKD